MFSSIYTFQLITSLLAVGAYLGYIGLFVEKNRNLSIILGLYVASALFDVNWLFSGLQEFKITALRQMAIRLLSFVAILTMVCEKDDLWIYTLIMSLTYFISALSLWCLMWRRVQWEKPCVKEVFAHFKPCIILFIPLIASSINRSMDKIMIGQICSLTEVGYYESAEKLIVITLGMVFSFGAVFTPKVSNLRVKGENAKAKQLLNGAMEVVMCMSIAVAFGIGAISKEFIPLYFGNDFIPAIILSIALSATFPITAWVEIENMLYLIPFAKDRIYVQSTVMGAVLNIFCNLLLIPRIGTMGAVIGTLVAEISVAVYQTYKSRDYLDIRVYLTQALIFCICGVIMTIAVRLVAAHVATGVLGVMLEILVGAVVYVILALIYFIKSQNPILMSAMEKRKKK